MADEENILKRLRVIAKVENSIPLSSDKDAYNAFLDMYDKGEIDLHDMLERFKEYTRATFRHAGNPDPVAPLFDTPSEAPKNSITDEEPRKQSRTVSVPAWVLVTLCLLVLGLTLVVGIGIGNPQGIAGIFASPTAMPTHSGLKTSTR